MSNSNSQLDRREFLCGSVAVAAAGALGVPDTARAKSQVAGLAPARTVPEPAVMFLEHFIKGWLPLQTAAADANWAAGTDVSEPHTSDQVAKNLELNRFLGAPQVIETVQSLLKNRASLPDQMVR